VVDEPSVELGIPGLGPAIRIGSGGFADVYRATQTNLRREVAVKVLRVAANDAQGRMRFERECHAVGAVSGHPNIVGVHEGGFTADGRAYLVMEYCPGGSLLDRIGRDGSMPTPELIEIGQKIGRALSVAHEAGVLHRDVKPANILITAYGEPALADFGIARVEGGQQTATGVVTASLAHAAPEVLGGEGPTAASDVYSLGSTLYELAVGQAPHYRSDEQSVWALMNRVVSEPVPDPRHHGILDPLAIVIRTATAKDLATRYRAAGDLVVALSIAPGGPSPAAQTPPPAAPIAPPSAEVGPPPNGPSPGPPATELSQTAAMIDRHDQPTAAMHPVGAGWRAATEAPSPGAPPTVPTPEVAPPAGPASYRHGATPPPNANDTATGDLPDTGTTRRRWLPIAVGAALVALLAGGAVGALALTSTQPLAALEFEFPAGADGPLDAGESYDLDIVGAEVGALFRYVVDGEAVGTATEELPPFVADPGRHSIAIEVTRGDDVTRTELVELYVIGDLPEPGYRANLSSITAVPENWSTALATFDRLTEDGHDDLMLLPSDRFPSLRPGFWNLFVPGFGDDREAASDYCDRFGLVQSEECFGSFFDPGS
jgi:serine/threonine protein kinase